MSGRGAAVGYSAIRSAASASSIVSPMALSATKGVSKYCTVGSLP